MRSVSLIVGDVFNELAKLDNDSVDMIFADPPYFLSNGGSTCVAGKRVSVDKADWDKTNDRDAFNKQWIQECFRILKPSGTIWISSTVHNIFSIGYCLEQAGYKLVNNITWQKTNPPPNLGCRCFTHSTENILWASKGKGYTFNYEVMKEMNDGKQMKDVWKGPSTPKSEKIFGVHPTQKPLWLLERIVLASTNEGDTILDPFCGTSTTGVAAVKYGRNYIGIDSSSEYIEISRGRISEINVE